MTTVYIDADACPVTRDAISVARGRGLPIVLVGNGTQDLSRSLGRKGGGPWQLGQGPDPAGSALGDRAGAPRFAGARRRWFPARGRRMSDPLLGYPDTVRRPGREQYLVQAEALGREYGVEAKRRALSLGEATQAFLFFRARFLSEIADVARRGSLETAQAAVLFEEADRSLDRVILALIAGHQNASDRVT